MRHSQGVAHFVLPEPVSAAGDPLAAAIVTAGPAVEATIFAPTMAAPPRRPWRGNADHHARDSDAYLPPRRRIVVAAIEVAISGVALAPAIAVPPPIPFAVLNLGHHTVAAIHATDGRTCSAYRRR